jgi:hypothetical protein
VYPANRAVAGRDRRVASVAWPVGDSAPTPPVRAGPLARSERIGRRRGIRVETSFVLFQSEKKYEYPV